MIYLLLYIVGMFPAGIAGYNAWTPNDGFPRWFLIGMTAILYPGMIIWYLSMKALTENV